MKRRSAFRALMRWQWVVCGMLLAVLSIAGCGKTAQAPVVDDNLTTRGTAEVTAELTEIKGELIDRPMYDYAFVFKYRVLKVHRGDIKGDTLYVAHYNPLKSRTEVADARVTDVGGTLDAFRVGDVHRMALEVPVDDFYMGGLVNRYFGEETGPIYWAVWTNPGERP